jgi:hypothetical protein
MRLKYDPHKSAALRRDPRRNIGFEEGQELLFKQHYLDLREPRQQWRAIGWVRDRLFTLIYEERTDSKGPYFHLVTLWPSSHEERRLYEKHC